MKTTRKQLEKKKIETSRTYHPIPYKTLFDGITERIMLNGFKIADQKFYSTDDKNIISCHFDIFIPRTMKNNTLYLLRLYFESSYNKLLRTRIGYGIVYNGSSYMTQLPQSTVTSYPGSIDQFNEYMDKYMDKKFMRDVFNDGKGTLQYIGINFNFDTEMIIDLCGSLYWYNITNGMQFKLIVKEMKNLLKEKDLVNSRSVIHAITKILDQTHPRFRLSKMHEFSLFMMEKYF